MKFMCNELKYIQFGSSQIKIEANKVYDTNYFPEKIRKILEYIIKNNTKQFHIIKDIETEERIEFSIPTTQETKIEDDEVSEQSDEEKIEEEHEKAQFEVLEKDDKDDMEIEEPEEIKTNEVEDKQEIEETKPKLLKKDIITLIMEKTDEYSKSQLTKMRVQELEELLETLL